MQVEEITATAFGSLSIAYTKGAPYGIFMKQAILGTYT